MEVGDFAWIIKPKDPQYGQKFHIEAVEIEFDGTITSYTLNIHGIYRDVPPADLEYTTRCGRKMTGQMQLF